MLNINIHKKNFFNKLNEKEFLKNNLNCNIEDIFSKIFYQDNSNKIISLIN